MSITTPPPRFTIRSCRPICVPVSQSSSSNAWLRVLCRSPDGTVADLGLKPGLARARRMITVRTARDGLVRDHRDVGIADQLQQPLHASARTTASRRSDTSRGAPARPTTAAPGGGSSMASTVWTRSELSSSGGMRASVNPPGERHDHPIGRSCGGSSPDDRMMGPAGVSARLGMAFAGTPLTVR